MAIISALKKFENSNDEIIIFSDSKNTVNQLNHEFAINNDEATFPSKRGMVTNCKLFQSYTYVGSKE